MGYKILCDSCTDFTPEMQAKDCFVRIPLTIDAGGVEFVDDEGIDTLALLRAMKASAVGTKTACPSPEQYMRYFDQAENIYIVTLSARLSGSHNAAEQAAKCYREEGGRHNVHVFNSRSASAGQAQIALLVRELAGRGLPFAQVVEQTEAYIARMQTMFVLENLDNLRKNGRLTRMQALVTGALRVKLLCGATREGEIQKLAQGLSIRQTLAKMVSRMAEDPGHAERRLVIAHCNCRERAEAVREMIQNRCRFGEILIVPTGGISTVYADDGGIVAAY